jgi:hypothetical protein
MHLAAYTGLRNRPVLLNAEYGSTMKNADRGRVGLRCIAIFSHRNKKVACIMEDTMQTILSRRHELANPLSSASTSTDHSITSTDHKEASQDNSCPIKVDRVWRCVYRAVNGREGLAESGCVAVVFSLAFARLRVCALRLISGSY